jgi:hypothetical protein
VLRFRSSAEAHASFRRGVFRTGNVAYRFSPIDGGCAVRRSTICTRRVGVYGTDVQFHYRQGPTPKDRGAPCTFLPAPLQPRVVFLELAPRSGFYPAPFPKARRDAAPTLSVYGEICSHEDAGGLYYGRHDSNTEKRNSAGESAKHPQHKGAPMKSMTKKLNIVCLLALAIILVACSKSSPPSQPQPPAQPEATATPPTATPAAEAPSAAPRAVKTEMRNVLFHLTEKGAAHLETLSGELVPTGKNQMPVMDDKTSFSVRVITGKMSITTDALADIMNNHVFAKSDSPLKDLSISIDKGLLIIKGKLHSKGDIPFQTAGSVSISSDGRIRMHTEKVKALGIRVKGMMGMLGIDLASVVNTSKIEGIDTDKNDLLMDLATLLPPPHIQGKLTGVKIENDAIVATYGDGGKSAAAATEKGNYMTFQGSSVRFGKITMENTDLTVLDLDPGDPLDWNQDHYKDQLVAGYSKITPAFGLRAYVKDFGKLGRGSASAVPKP